jgi:hypothetical protein
MPGEVNAAAKKIANQMAYQREGADAYTHWYGYTGPGYCVAGGGKRCKFNIEQFSIAVWVVPEGQPMTKLAYSNSKEIEPEGLQAHFEAVPLPTLALIPAGHLICPVGTDQWIVIWQPSTDRYWEMGDFNPETLTFAHGGFREGLNKWSGVFTNTNEGERACALALVGGMISTQDMVEILEGKKLKHALTVNIPVTKAAGPIAPATHQDQYENELAEYEGKANPAFGTVDAVAQAAWFRFPAASTPAEYGISQATSPIAWAVFEAIREYGMVVGDSGPSATPSIQVQYPAEMGSPYAWAHVNPYKGAPSTWGRYTQGEAGGNAWIPSTITTPKKVIQEIPLGVGNPLVIQPWQILEQVEPRSA